MNQFITAVLTSLSSGAIYALMSIALVLVWRSTRVINFAQAGQAILTTYIDMKRSLEVVHIGLG